MEDKFNSTVYLNNNINKNTQFDGSIAKLKESLSGLLNKTQGNFRDNKKLKGTKKKQSLSKILCVSSINRKSPIPNSFTKKFDKYVISRSS